MLDKVFLTQRERAVLKKIPKGKNNRITRKELSDTFRLSERAIKSIVRHLRNKGVPIMADRTTNIYGYWLPNTEEERKNGLAAYKKQIEEELKTLQAMMHSDLDYEKHFEEEYV